jgi:hypothetical protein
MARLTTAAVFKEYNPSPKKGLVPIITSPCKDFSLI